MSHHSLHFLQISHLVGVLFLLYTLVQPGHLLCILQQEYGFSFAHPLMRKTSSLQPPLSLIPPVASYSSWARGARPRGRRTWPLPVTPCATHSCTQRSPSGSAGLCPSSQQGSLGDGHCHPPTRLGGPTLASVPQAGCAYSSTPDHPGNPRPSGRTRVTNTKQQQISGARVRGERRLRNLLSVRPGFPATQRKTGALWKNPWL